MPVPTEREMAEAYIQSVEREADALIARGVQLKQHVSDCLAELAKEGQAAEPPAPDEGD